MENTMVVSTTKETQVSDPIIPIVPDISLNPEDFQKEIRKIAAEQGQAIVNGNAVPIAEVVQPSVQNQPQTAAAAAQPEPQAAIQPVSVPPKFQTQDGQVDLEKVQKSTINAQEALSKYAQLERELRQKQNEVNKLQAQSSAAVQQPQFVPTYPQVPQTYPKPQLTPQVINDAIAKNGAGPVLLELQQLTFNAATEQARQFYEGQIQELRNKVEAKERTSELQAIADIDPWVYTEEGIKTLGAIRQAKPWLNNAPEPWLESYKAYKAEQMLRPNPSVQTINPMAPQRAPATPVGAGNRSMPSLPSLAILTQDKGMLNAMLNQMTPQQQEAFFEQAFKAGGLK